ncbi:MAG: alpha/beta hydrolase [Lautropia sp.]
MLDLRYGPGPKETLDLFVPKSGSRGTFVFIHGGYWRAMDKADHLFVADVFVARGYAVAVVNYDLCPVVSIGTIVTECRRAIAWLVNEGERLGIRLDEAEAARLSPVLYPPATPAPVLVAVGGDETSAFVRQTHLIWEGWPANRPVGGDAGPLVIPGRHHFSVIVDLADPESALTRTTLGLFGPD